MSLNEQMTEENYACMNTILGKEGRHNPCVAYTKTELEGIEYLEYLLDKNKSWESKLEKFLPKEW